MIKVLIVDDETLARINLRHLINWEREGCTVCGEADGGAEALKKIEELMPDIVFTDMNMPGMSGVDFIKAARLISPSVRLVAFSAFEDFEYVRQSLKEGALDYLVKHKLDAGSLSAILRAVKDSISRETTEKQKIDRMMEMASSGKALIQQNVLRNLLNGYIQEDFRAVLKEYDICLDDRRLVVAAARMDNYYGIKERFTAREFAVFMESVNNILANACSEAGKMVYVNMEDGRFAFIMSFAGAASEAQINAKAVSGLCGVEGTVKRFLNITMSFGVSGICHGYSKLKDFYGEACMLLEKGYYKGTNYIIQKNELVNGSAPQTPSGLSAAEEKHIIACIRGLKKEGVEEAVNRVFSGLKAGKASHESAKIVSIDLINILNRMAKEFGITPNTIYPSNAGLYEEIRRCGTLDELRLRFRVLFNSLFDALEGNGVHTSCSPPVKKAVEYILSNYHRNISLSDVSEHVKVSPQYLSKLFKEECRRGFVSYLNNVRIERAKRMLEEGAELKELAGRLGFNHYTYFFTVFKEITGITPQQYEKAVSARRDTQALSPEKRRSGAEKAFEDLI